MAAMSESHHAIDLADISFKPSRLRALRPEVVAELAESMAARGLLQPIVVLPDGKGYWLIAGRHRFEAARRLGWTSISATVLDGVEADQAELIEIDENLIRAELSPAERALHVGRRKALYERLHPETKHGGAPGAGRGKGKRKKDANLASFQEQTAKTTGKSRRSVERDATRANKVTVLADIAGTSLDKGDEIDALAKLPEDEQRKLAECAQAGDKVSAKARVEQMRQAEREPEKDGDHAVEVADYVKIETRIEPPQTQEFLIASRRDPITGEIHSVVGTATQQSSAKPPQQPSAQAAKPEPEEPEKTESERPESEAQAPVSSASEPALSMESPPVKLEVEEPKESEPEEPEPAPPKRIRLFRLWLQSMSPTEISGGLSPEEQRALISDTCAISEWLGTAVGGLRDASLASDQRVKLKLRSSDGEGAASLRRFGQSVEIIESRQG
jgi:hypothetical protein